MPGTSTPLTVTSFGRCVRLSANLLNLRPIVLLPSTAADPHELVAASPTSLRGPAHCQWAPLGAGRDYSGQAAIIQQQQQQFRKNWIKFYSRRLRATHQMAPDGPGWQEGAIVLISDLASRSGRDHPHARLARITGWLDKQKSQAILTYQGGTVNRPVGKLSLLLDADQEIPEKGLLFDPLIQADQTVFEENRAVFAADQGANQGATQGANQGATQGANQGATQGANQGATQGADQGANQGADQGADQGATQGATQGADQGADQGPNQGADQGAMPGPALPLAVEPAMPPAQGPTMAATGSRRSHREKRPPLRFQ